MTHLYRGTQLKNTQKKVTITRILNLGIAKQTTFVDTNDAISIPVLGVVFFTFKSIIVLTIIGLINFYGLLRFLTRFQLCYRKH